MRAFAVDDGDTTMIMSRRHLDPFHQISTFKLHPTYFKLNALEAAVNLVAVNFTPTRTHVKSTILDFILQKDNLPPIVAGSKFTLIRALSAM